MILLHSFTYVLKSIDLGTVLTSLLTFTGLIVTVLVSLYISQKGINTTLKEGRKDREFNLNKENLFNLQKKAENIIEGTLVFRRLMDRTFNDVKNGRTEIHKDILGLDPIDFEKKYLGDVKTKLYGTIQIYFPELYNIYEEYSLFVSAVNYEFLKRITDTGKIDSTGFNMEGIKVYYSLEDKLLSATQDYIKDVRSKLAD